MEGIAIHRTPTRVTIREQLSNGQTLSVWFFRRRNKRRGMALSNDKEIAFIWTVAIYIGTIKEADRWVRTPYKHRVRRIRQTGTCGLEGMRAALRHLIDQCERLGFREEMQIICEDEKRFRAYSYLFRHFNGFTRYLDEDKKDHIGFRHPNYWDWIPNEPAEAPEKETCK